MNTELINLIELYEIACEEIYADLSVANYYGRQWTEPLINRVLVLDVRGELILNEIKENNELYKRVNKILNQLDNFQLVGKRKGLI